MIIWESVLKENEYFKGISESEIAPLLEFALEKKYSDKEIIFTEGALKEFIFVLGSGTVLISKVTEQGDESVINIITKQEIFPHTGLFDSKPYPGTATAKKDVVVLMIPFHAFERFVKENPKFSYRIIQMMSKKIYMLQKKLNQMITLNVEERLLATLKQLTVVNKNKSIPLTHQELGNIIGASRETVTRQIKKLEKQGKLKISKDQIIYIDHKNESIQE